MLRVGKAFLLLARDVTGHAAFRICLGTGVKRKDQLGAGHFLGGITRGILFGIRMGFAGTVAGLTSGNAGGMGEGALWRPAPHPSASSGNPPDR